MALRMIDFYCTNCKLEFEEIVFAENGIKEKEPCPKCGKNADMIMDIDKRVHRQGNRYRDVSWSTWAIS